MGIGVLEEDIEAQLHFERLEGFRQGMGRNKIIGLATTRAACCSRPGAVTQVIIYVNNVFSGVWHNTTCKTMPIGTGNDRACQQHVGKTKHIGQSKIKLCWGVWDRLDYGGT